MRARNPMRRSWLDDTQGGWIAHRLVLVTSAAWRERPKPLANILDRLEIEHMRHAGKENGHLFVSYEQFVAAGVSRKVIRAAEEAGVALGLLRVELSETILGNIRGATRYGLTYVPEKGKRAPTDEWLDVTQEKADSIVAAFQRVAAQKRGPSYPRGTRTGSPFGQKTGPTGSPFGHSPVTQGELSSISASPLRNVSRRAEEGRPTVRAPAPRSAHAGAADPTTGEGRPPTQVGEITRSILANLSQVGDRA